MLTTAADAYTVGQVLGMLLPLALGITLLVVGLRRRAATPPPPSWSYGGPAAPPSVWGQPTEGPLSRGPSAPTWTPEPAAPPVTEPAPDPTPPADSYFAPPTPQPSADAPQWAPQPAESQPAPPPGGWPAPSEPAAKRGGTGLIIAGAIIAGLSLLGLAARGALLAAGTEREVALPETVIGLERNPSASAQVAESFLQAAPEDLIDPHAALYGTPGNAVLVIAARAHTAFPSRQLDSFRKGFESSGEATLTNGRDVDPGDLGGAARCWIAHIKGVEPGVCIFVDRGSLVATIDFLPGGPDAAAERGRQIREATVHKT